MFCTKCGKELVNPGRFCNFCGAPLQNVQAAAPQQPMPQQQAPQQPIRPDTVLYQGVSSWNRGGVIYQGCYVIVTYEKMTVYRNQRSVKKGEQPLVVIFCNTIREIRMTGNFNGPYMILTMADGKSLNFRYLLRLADLHTACQTAARFHNPQWFQ